MKKEPVVAGKEIVDGEYIAKLLAVRPSVVRDWGRDGKIPRIVLSPRTIRYDLDAVLAALGLAREAVGLLGK